MGVQVPPSTPVFGSISAAQRPARVVDNSDDGPFVSNLSSAQPSTLNPAQSAGDLDNGGRVCALTVSLAHRELPQALSKSRRAVHDYVGAARKTLECLPPSESRTGLLGLTEYLAQQTDALREPAVKTDV